MIEKINVVYPPKGTERTLHIYLPDDYETSGEQYPVMYFFDGQNLYSDWEATYGTCWGLKDFLDGWEKKMIVVGMECSHQGNDRLDEYSPYSFAMGHWGYVRGIGAQTMNWIVEEIKPMIDARYRTYPFREATGIGGSSMGGLMSLYAAAAYNETFSKAACLSSTVSPCFAVLAREILRHRLDADTRVYLSWGTEEAGHAQEDTQLDWLTQTARNNLAIEALLRQQNVDTFLYCQRYGRHCEADWREQVPKFMNYLWLEQP